MNHINTLVKAGLSEKEASVYLASYELGESTVARIAQKSDIKRSTAYLELESLIKKGLVSQSIKKNIKYYTAQSPKVILSTLEENKNELEQSMKSILSLGNAIDKKPSVRYFEGEEGIKEAYRDTLAIPNKEIQSWFSSTTVDDSSFQMKHYVPERVKRNIWMRIIVPDSASLKPYIEKNPEQLRIVKTIEEEKYNMENELMLYDKNKIAILNYGDKIGIIIESPKIHNSLKQIFEIMWETLPDQKK